MKNPIPYVIAAIALMLGAALVQGQWSERWGEFPELEAFGKRIELVPMDVGDWRGIDLDDMDKRTMNAAGAVGSLSREYTHRINKEWKVRVHIVCGRMVDVFFHTPDRCYPANGFSTVSDPAKQIVMFGPKRELKAEFMTASFLKSDRRGSSPLQIFWNWSADGQWEAPDAPKLKYAGQHALYKVYLESGAPNSQQGVNESPSVEFARVLLPELTKAFFPGSEALKAQTAAAAQLDAEKSPAAATPDEGDSLTP